MKSFVLVLKTAVVSASISLAPASIDDRLFALLVGSGLVYLLGSAILSYVEYFK